MSQQVIAFAGFGLIGGSIAKGIKKEKGSNVLIRVYDNVGPDALKQAKEDNIVDEIVTQIDSNFADCDFLFLCAPVQANIQLLREIKPFLKPSCLITDVGSVKGIMHSAVRELGLGSQFIGGHPMAGSEKTGYLNASSSLLENAFYLLTTTGQTTQEQMDLLTNLLSCTGAICVTLDAKQHDRITAAISHVPHILAVTLVQMVYQNDDNNEYMKKFAAGGFKDITRIASSSPEMWQSICLSNGEEITHFLDVLCNLLTQFKELINSQNGDKINYLFSEAGAYRTSIPSGKGSITERIFELYLDVADETGVLAHVATQLANEGISIKNIGIIHNREFADGALRIEFYREEDLQSAKSLFTLLTLR